MPANFEWSESNEDPRVDTDGISNLNFGDVDAPNIVPNDYQIIQGNNSYEKYIRGKFSGTFTRIWKMKFWKSSGIYKTGEIIKAKENVAYDTPQKTTSTKAIIEVPNIIGNALEINADKAHNWLEIHSTNSDNILGGGASDFTIDLWVYLDSSIWLGDGDILIFNAPERNAFYLKDRKLKCRIDTTGGIFEDFISSNQVPLDTWTHIAFVKNGTDIIGFIDGIKEVGSVGTLPSNTLINQISKCYIGGDFYTGKYYRGNMDEIRVSTIARWVADFVPEVAEYVSDVNTSLLIHCNKINGVFTFADSSSNTWGVISERVYTDLDEKKFGNASAMFAGHTVIQEPEYTEWMILQLQTTLDADMGDVNEKEFVMQFDES